MQKSEEKGSQGERHFANLCNSWHYEFLQIHQGVDTMSSEMVQKIEKRPDFLINISDVGPIFIEVKTKKSGYVKEVPSFPKETAFGLSHDEYNRMCRFEKSMGLKIWYAFIEDKGNLIDHTTAYMCPSSRVGNFIPSHSIENPGKWPDIFVPIRCMNRCQNSLDLSNKCLDCKNRRCEAKDGFL